MEFAESDELMRRSFLSPVLHDVSFAVWQSVTLPDIAELIVFLCDRKTGLCIVAIRKRPESRSIATVQLPSTVFLDQSQTFRIVWITD